LLQERATDGIQRLNGLREQLRFPPLKPDVDLRKAAELWAESRTRGFGIADDKELDMDVILAAQALDARGEGDVLIVATYNVRLSSRYVDARDWRAITPNAEE
jgi:hypothetical protein